MALFYRKIGVKSSLGTVGVEFLQILGHFLNFSVVMILDFSDESGVVWWDKVDGDTLSSESTGSTNSMDVVFLFEWKLVVDNKTNLLDINTSCQQVGGDEHSGGTSSEFLHDSISFDLIHFSVHCGNCEIVFVHLFFQIENSLLCVTVDQSLVDVQVSIEVEKNFDLPLLLFNCNIVLTDTFKSQVFTLDKNFLWISHEMFGQRKDLIWHSSGEKCNLHIPRKEFENLLNLGLEASREHFICLVHNKESQILSSEESLFHHVVNSTGCSHHYMYSLLEELDVFSNRGTTDTCMNNCSLILSNGLNNKGNLQWQFSRWRNNKSLNVFGSCIDNLQGSNGEGSCFTSTWLGLYYKITC